jgi:hypothetical protein
MIIIMREVLLLLLPMLALSWWDVGHMLTAAIAEIKLNQLDPYASVHFRELTTSINALVDNRSRTFIECACWPDDIKGSQYKMNLFDPLHFKDRYRVIYTVRMFMILSHQSSITLSQPSIHFNTWQPPKKYSGLISLIILPRGHFLRDMSFIW